MRKLPLGQRQRQTKLNTHALPLSQRTGNSTWRCERKATLFTAAPAMKTATIICSQPIHERTPTYRFRTWRALQRRKAEAPFPCNSRYVFLDYSGCERAEGKTHLIPRPLVSVTLRSAGALRPLAYGAGAESMATTDRGRQSEEGRRLQHQQCRLPFFHSSYFPSPPLRC